MCERCGEECECVHGIPGCLENGISEVCTTCEIGFDQAADLAEALARCDHRRAMPLWCVDCGATRSAEDRPWLEPESVRAAKVVDGLLNPSGAGSGNGSDEPGRKIVN